MRESNLLQHIYRANASLDAAGILIPPGDDMAALRTRSGATILVAVDQVVDGLHVNVGSMPLELIGRKAVCRSVSDIAAMAARPIASLAAGTLPPDWEESRANTLFDAMRTAAAEQHCPLIGGDIAIHRSADHPLTLSVTVLAVPGDTPPVRRDGARIGDGVYVTGALGGSFGDDGLGRHLTFEPRVEVALQLAATLGANLHAMIDISDGLGRDAGRIAAASDVRIALRARDLPCNPGVDWRAAASDGEDYELCFTAAGEVPDSIAGVPITKVGEVVAPSGGEPVVVHIDGEVLAGGELGWDHGGGS